MAGRRGQVCIIGPEAEEGGYREGRRRFTEISPTHGTPKALRFSSGCWAKYRPMAVGVVGGTLMDTHLDQSAASPLPGQQRPHGCHSASGRACLLHLVLPEALALSWLLKIQAMCSHSAIQRAHSCVPWECPSLGALPEYLKDRQGCNVPGYFSPWEKSLFLSGW